MRRRNMMFKKNVHNLSNVFNFHWVLTIWLWMGFRRSEFTYLRMCCYYSDDQELGVFFVLFCFEDDWVLFGYHWIWLVYESRSGDGLAVLLLSYDVRSIPLRTRLWCWNSIQFSKKVPDNKTQWRSSILRDIPHTSERIPQSKARKKKKNHAISVLISSEYTTVYYYAIIRFRAFGK